MMNRLILFIILIFSEPLWAEGVLEEFENGSGGFLERNGFTVSAGQLNFTGNRNGTSSFVEWNGGSNPGGWSPVPGNTNYFSDFGASVEVTWKGGVEDQGYGLSVCNQENSSNTADYVRFLINGVNNDAAYTIEMVKNDNFQILTDWTTSSAIIPNGTNKLYIFKQGNSLVFSINDIEVETLEINGCIGGSVGMEASDSLDVAFDNFKLLPFFYESFDNRISGFPNEEFFFVSNEQLVFRGDGSDELQSLPWNGGYNPGGLAPNLGHSNYFENFNISVDALWEGGSNTGGYGLSVCNHKNSSDTLDYVLFVITGEGAYSVDTHRNGGYEKLVDWTNSSLINTYGTNSNKLSITKKDNQLSFSINDIEVEQLVIDECLGGSIDLEASNNVNVAFDKFFLIDLPSTKSTSTQPIPNRINQRPVANFSVTPTSGKAPLTVTLDASDLSTDPDGTITNYQWNSSDSQTASGSTTTMTFGIVGTYTISLLVTDNEEASSNPLQRTVTVLPDDALPPTPPPVDEGELSLAFEGLQDFYRIGDKVKIDLALKARRNRFERIDLWVAIKMPTGKFLFKTDIPMAPFSPQPQAFKKSIESIDESERLLEFELPPGLGGDYIFYAAFVAEGKNPVSNGLAIQSITNKKTTLAN